MAEPTNTGQPRMDEHSPSTIHGEPARQMKSYTEVRKWMETNHSPVNDTTSLHLHFLDYEDTETNVPETDVQETDVLEMDNNLADKLSNDLKTLCQLTDGILLTSGAGTIVRTALKKFKLELNDFDIKGSIAVAIPTMENWRELDGLDSFNHILWSDSKDVQGHLQTRLISAAELDQTKPSICLMVGGGPQTLKRACYALARNIPIILMKGSRGLADLLVDLANATDQQIERHQERR
ncbi:uncharacterized protein [Littorina saxatilis]|uniref:uncharacterized protein n=1 Tax=Littorina saxatilis TaxID=31220 RepID=UPI0038B4E879